MFYGSDVGLRWLASDLRKYGADPCAVASLNYRKIDGEWYFEMDDYGTRAYAETDMDPKTAAFLRLLGVKEKIPTIELHTKMGHCQTPEEITSEKEDMIWADEVLKGCDS